MTLTEIINKRIGLLKKLRENHTITYNFERANIYTDKIELLESILAEYYDN